MVKVPVRLLVLLAWVADARAQSADLYQRPQSRPRDGERRRVLQQPQERLVLVHQMAEEPPAEPVPHAHPDRLLLSGFEAV